MDEVEYAQVPWESWTAPRITAEGGAHVAAGDCPRCHHGMRVTLGYVVTGILPDTAAFAERDDLCACGRPHTGRPADAVDVGCGAYWHWTPVAS